jgi:histidine triad (HIT) family protein
MTLPENASADCAFCEIVGGKEATHVVFEDDICLAFLDRRPLFWGHLLLIPKAHYPTLTDLPSDLVGSFFTNVQLLAQAVEQAMQAQGSFVAINNRVSQSVPHLHVHIVPRNRKDGLRGFFWPRTKYRDEDQMQEVRDALRKEIAELQSK